MIVYRIAKAKHSRDLSGVGARLYGGRWNQKGTAVLYTSETRALATLEYLVHVSLPLTPGDIQVVSISIPDHASCKDIDSPDLPAYWRDYPAPAELAQIGTEWALASETLLLRVPSVIVKHEYNMLINPGHPEMDHVTIIQAEDFALDARLSD